MCANERKGPRKPATKFPNLQKKMSKQRPVPLTAPKSPLFPKSKGK